MPDNWLNFILIFAAATLLSVIMTKAVMALARRYKIFDYPSGERKIHTAPIPLLGGSAVYGSWLIAVLFLYFSGQLRDVWAAQGPLLWCFLLAGLVLIVNGILDDKYNLPASVTILGPIVAAAVVMAGGLAITHITHPTGGVIYLNNLFGNGSLSLLWLPPLVTFLWLLGVTYTTKLLDGLDGLTASIGLVASIIIFVVSLSWDVRGSSTSLLTVALAGAIFGFLVFNWHPARIFLGEGGSTFIGFALGVLAVISGSKIATALLVMGLPVLDIFWVVIRRLRRGQAWWRGDREHLHFRLLSAGWQQRHVVFFFILVSLTFGVISIFFTTKTKIGALVVLLIFMFALSSWLSYKLKARHENN